MQGRPMRLADPRGGRWPPALERRDVVGGAWGWLLIVHLIDINRLFRPMTDLYFIVPLHVTTLTRTFPPCSRLSSWLLRSRRAVEGRSAVEGV
ncbi:hypothetical protein N657DRAFT_343399 [Parathielavia appendiculata]|uniref:Uncharacterized protein n=1 Tax=Parathielavia appendiculata TaxID=2587402 RepID=A0AAN6U2J6_9PEZI|nr:hypothetical protein N657DRAFT_343399 [Parathielavia appendiculata]